VVPVPGLVHLHAGCGQQQVYVHSKVYCEDVCPSAKLDTWVQKISPTAAAANNSGNTSGSGAILPLGQRDVLPGARQVRPGSVTVCCDTATTCVTLLNCETAVSPLAKCRIVERCCYALTMEVSSVGLVVLLL
jgi:hypothetical protein